MATDGAPSPREGQVAVWTGSAMLVWGGLGAARPGQQMQDLGDGASYDVSANVWAPLRLATALSPRHGATGVWAGRELLVWGGHDAAGVLGDGAAYRPLDGTWRPPTARAASSARYLHTAVWDGQDMLVWGGMGGRYGLAALGDGARYDPVADAWSELPADGAPAPRDGHTTVWTGAAMLVWGGVGERLYGDGAAFDPAAGRWPPLPTAGAPSPRAGHSAVWTGRMMMIWGGSHQSGRSWLPLGDGAAFGPAPSADARAAALPRAGGGGAAARLPWPAALLGAAVAAAALSRGWGGVARRRPGRRPPRRHRPAG